MKLDIQTGVIFANTSFSKVPVSYKGLTADKFKVQMKQMAQTIINEFSPDYLNLYSEPDTLANLTGIKEFNTKNGFVDYVNYIMDGLQKGNTLIGAGGATWIPLAVNRGVLEETKVDFIPLHIYPLNKNITTNIMLIINEAKRLNKKVIIDEAWLYKATGAESLTGVAATEKVFKRDVFSFWYPLDQEFMKVMAKLAGQKQIEFLSFFWSSYFFSYVDYTDQTKNLNFSQLSGIVGKSAWENIQKGIYSPTGQYYKDLISSY